MKDHDHDDVGTSVQLHKYYHLHSTSITPNHKFRINRCGQLSPNFVHQTHNNFSKLLLFPQPQVILCISVHGICNHHHYCRTETPQK